MSKHTKGPWIMDKYENVVDSNGCGFLFRGLSILCSGGDERLSEARANTLLASCAPELLEALVGYDQSIRVAIKMLNRTGSQTAHEIGDELTARLRIACDAIAKARGES